jgi:hypothetical protein
MGAFVLWRPGSRNTHAFSRRPKASFGILALGCVLVLLFPVISLTDDLHAEQVSLEDSSRPILKARSIVQGCLGATSMLFIAAGAHTPIWSVLPALFGKVYPTEARSIRPAPVFSHVGRSPPCYV